MITEIDVRAVLSRSVAEFHHDLVTRPTGRAVRTSIETELRQYQGMNVVVLDFSAVRLIDWSCADEIVAKLLLDADPGADRYVMLFGAREDHAEAIDHVLNHHALAIAVVAGPDQPPRLLGRVTPELERVFHCVVRLGPGDAGSVADTLGWTLERAADALLTLALLRVLRVEAGTFHPLRL